MKVPTLPSYYGSVLRLVVGEEDFALFVTGSVS
jgi:hypothetical protein